MTTVDVQIVDGGVALTALGVKGKYKARNGNLALHLEHEEFDQLAAKVAEVALAKRGAFLETVSLDEVEVGDRVLGMEVTSSQPDPNGTHHNVFFGGHSVIHMPSTTAIEIERPVDTDE